MSTLESRYREILQRIAHAKVGPHVSSQVQLIAVSKYQEVDAIEELYHLGQRDFGENYVQELIEKANILKERGCSEIRWHFIGHLQTNKVKALVPYVSYVHTLDSVKLAQELAKRWSALAHATHDKLPVLVEVNIDNETTKSGILKSDLAGVIDSISQIQGLNPLGLMCIPSAETDPRSKFIELRELEEQCQPVTHGVLSMGMSSDFELAIQEGATFVRVGTALFGERKKS